MSVKILAVATESGVPIFSRKRGNDDNIQFSTIASLHGINTFSKCHNISIANTEVDNGRIIWKEYCKSITLIGVATGGLEHDLELLLSFIHDAMVLCIGLKELDSLKNIDQIKRDLRQSFPMMDFLMESLDPNKVSTAQPTLVIDLIQSALCSQAQQLQHALDCYAERVTGHWACLIVHGNLVSTSSDFGELSTREARLLFLLASLQTGAPLRETPIFLPQMSPNVAFRAVTCKLLADVYVTVVCGATPALSEIDEIVLQCWEGYTQVVKEAKLVHPRNFPLSLKFESCVLGVLIINIAKRLCVFSRHLNTSNPKHRSMPGSHRLDILRTFYVTTAREIAPELKYKDFENKNLQDVACSINEAYWCSEYHKCHAQRSGNVMCCVLYESSVPTNTMRFVTAQILQDFNNNKDIFW